MKVSVVIAAKAEVLCVGIRGLLSNVHDINVVGTCSTGQEVMTRVPGLKPDILLLDQAIAEPDCVETTRWVNVACPDTRVVLLDDSSEATLEILHFIGAGIKAYLPKDMINRTRLIHSISYAYAGHSVLSPFLAERLIAEVSDSRKTRAVGQERGHINLSKRQIEVLNLVARGLSNKEVADTLFITENTVKAHLSKIMDKLHVHSRVQAAGFVRQTDASSTD